MSEAGKRLIGAAREARQIARGDIQPRHVLVAPDVDVREIRQALSMSQEAFAQNYGFSLGQIRDWEQSRARPIGALRAYLLIIKQRPEMVAQTFAEHLAETNDDSTLIAM